MLSGLWYEYLKGLNNDMALVGRNIVLITNNYPSLPHTNKPPKGYTGPPPPNLTHVTLVYLPKNTTSYLQPLDQGIIRSFKASYRRKYAQHLVESFNLTNIASKPIDILQAIHFISDAWLELPPSLPILSPWYSSPYKRSYLLSWSSTGSLTSWSTLPQSGSADVAHGNTISETPTCSSSLPTPIKNSSHF